MFGSLIRETASTAWGSFASPAVEAVSIAREFHSLWVEAASLGKPPAALLVLFRIVLTVVGKDDIKAWKDIPARGDNGMAEERFPPFTAALMAEERFPPFRAIPPFHWHGLIVPPCTAALLKSNSGADCLALCRAAKPIAERDADAVAVLTYLLRDQNRND